MEVILLNGSPRKNWNTAALLHEAAKGAQSAGAKAEVVNLYDLDFKGCRGCMACNREGESWGRCVWPDDLKPVLEQIDKADGLILGSPVYWSDITAEMRAVLERFRYQYTDCDDYSSVFGGHLKAGFIYTMNVSAGMMSGLYQKYEEFLQPIAEYVGTVECAETLQVNDYSKFHLGYFDGNQRHRRHETEFPKDCKRAFELGRRVAGA